jgi:D-tyrosyl-tRNA(Tyr) deacylase
MRALLQRVSRAEVRIADDVLGKIDQGLVVFLGVGTHDLPHVADSLASKIVDLRVFVDEAGKTNRSLQDVNGEMLVVSQFTLYADTSRGRRPGFTRAAPPDAAVPLYERFCAAVEAAGVIVARGEFGAQMFVELVNEGPFTLWLDTDQQAQIAARRPRNAGAPIK